MPVSAAINQVDGTAKLIYVLDSGSGREQTAPTPDVSAPNMMARMMGKAKAAAKPSFPSDLKFTGVGGAKSNPAKLFDRLKLVLRDDYKMGFKQSQLGSAKQLIKDLSALLWSMDKCDAMRKLQSAGHSLPVPALLEKCMGCAADDDGRVGGSHKAKNSANAMTHNEIAVWIQTLHAFTDTQAVGTCDNLGAALSMLADSLQRYCNRQANSYVQKEIAVDLGQHKTPEEDATVYLLPAGDSSRTPDVLLHAEWVEALFNDSDEPIRITDDILTHVNMSDFRAVKKFETELALSFPVYCFKFTPGGPTRAERWLWRAETEEGDTDGCDDGRIKISDLCLRGLLKTRAHIKTYATQREYNDFKAQVEKMDQLCKIPPAAMKVFFEEASGLKVQLDHGAGGEDTRLFEEIREALRSEDPQEIIDLRSIKNGANMNTAFLRFWEVGKELIDAQYAKVDDRRHGADRMSNAAEVGYKPIASSIRTLREKIKAACEEKYPDDEIVVPSDWLIGMQFIAPDPRSNRANRYTGFFGVKHQVQVRIDFFPTICHHHHLALQ
jgi:hypothetical protein